MEKQNNLNGVWRTVGGRRIFIANGEDLATAMKKSGKFNNKMSKEQLEKTNKGINELESRIKKTNPNYDKDKDFNDFLENVAKKETTTNKFTDSKGNEIEFIKPNGKEFLEKLKEAKTSQPEEKRWRVDDVSHTAKDYDKMNLYLTTNNSTIAVTKDGDIVSLCSNVNSKDRGRTMMELAVANGGKKLDTYDGNYGFYIKCGFEPVSWCEFNEEYAPADWKKGRDNPENIIFFKYTGKESNYKTKEEFYNNVKVSNDYDEAMNIRDKEVK